MRPKRVQDVKNVQTRIAGLFLLAAGVATTSCSNSEKQTPADVGPAEQFQSVRGEPLRLFTTRPIGAAFSSPPKISHLQVVDLDQDGLLDLVVCDCENNLVSWIKQGAEGNFDEQTLQQDLPAPAHAQCVDFDLDGDLDILVAVLGVLFPNDDPIGSVVILENLGNEKFKARRVLEKVARVSDVRAADLDGDGDLDLAVTHFGYYSGEFRWMENLGDWQFKSTILQSLPGGIHGVVDDINGDGAPDISLLVSQEFERVYLFLGDGRGGFEEKLVYEANNPDFGSSGLWTEDLDQDGDRDILFTNGDAFDYSPPHPWPWHGVQWLENQGEAGFEYHRLAAFGGAVCAQAVDYDFDGDLDIFASSTFNEWENPESQSLIVLVNDGDMNFVEHDLANTPSHIQSIALADLNGDGILDLVSGGMHVSEPYDRVQRILLWEGLKPEDLHR